MSDLLSTGATWLNAQNQLHRARTVVYVRAGVTESITCAVGKTVFRIENTYGTVQHIESRDFLVSVSELAAFGEPQAGDTIRDTLNGVVMVYEVMAPGGEPAFRYADDYRIAYRIHTKNVGEFND